MEEGFKCLSGVFGVEGESSQEQDPWVAGQQSASGAAKDHQRPTKQGRRLKSMKIKVSKSVDKEIGLQVKDYILV